MFPDFLKKSIEVGLLFLLKKCSKFVPKAWATDRKDLIYKGVSFESYFTLWEKYVFQNLTRKATGL